ncbi:MAG: DUF5752 family protein [Nanoarchaeota archaeon]
MGESNNIKEYISDTKPEFYFRLNNGAVVKSIPELADALSKIPEDIFNYHSNDNRNDFSSWIRDVFGEKELAEELSKVSCKTDAQLCVLRYLVKMLMSNQQYSK